VLFHLRVPSLWFLGNELGLGPYPAFTLLLRADRQDCYIWFCGFLDDHASDCSDARHEPQNTTQAGSNLGRLAAQFEILLI